MAESSNGPAASVPASAEPPAPASSPTPGSTGANAAGTGRSDDRDEQPGGGRGGKGKKRKDWGRKAFKRYKGNGNEAKRAKTQDAREDIREEATVENSDGEEGPKEQRRPKKKVAVLVSYCGTGYKGMQWNPPFKSIEGDLFEAFGKAGAISIANSKDPKKSSFVRCARTDKGVHAAGNIISLKLIVEDPDIVQKINSHLPEQIRVLDIVRTTGSFSCYQAVDSRVYEYLLPSHSFLPPHPKTYLAQVCREIAEREGDLEGYLERQKDADGWWDEVDKKVEEMLKDVDREEVDHAMESENEDHWEPDSRYRRSLSPQSNSDVEDTDRPKDNGAMEVDEKPIDDQQEQRKEEKVAEEKRAALLKRVRAVHNEQKRAYRIPPERLERVRETFRQYVGTRNYWNYTERITFKDASARRHIKSFEVVDPVIINGTEWLSCRVHGQSFMMHQIRKMVGMAMMIVRLGCPSSRVAESFGPTKLSIPKAPSLGLLLEAPVFDSYNTRVGEQYNYGPIDFGKHKDTVDAFKQKYIYTKIFDEEYNMNTFTQFYQFLDTHKATTYLYLTSAGLKAIEPNEAKPKDSAEAKTVNQGSAAKKGEATAEAEPATKEDADAVVEDAGTLHDADAADGKPEKALGGTESV